MSNEHYLNPFDDEAAAFTVLSNARAQFSLWPQFAARPAGWEQRFGPAPRSACVEFIEQNWSGINPFATQAGARA